MKRIFGILALSALTMMSCDGDPDGEESTDSNTDNSCGTYTYDGEVKDIITAQCLGCHDNSQSPNLTNYAEVKAQIDRIKARAVDQKTMPPSGSLSASQLEILECWIEDDGPEDLQ